MSYVTSVSTFAKRRLVSKISDERGAKKVRYNASGKKGQVPNAAGQAIPPMVVFNVKKLNHSWIAHEIPSIKHSLSDKGWINTDLFKEWLVEHFLGVCIASTRPLLLLLDGHVTHYQPRVIQFARAH